MLMALVQSNGLYTTFGQVACRKIIAQIAKTYKNFLV